MAWLLHRPSTHQNENEAENEKDDVEMDENGMDEDGDGGDIYAVEPAQDVHVAVDEGDKDGPEDGEGQSTTRRPGQLAVHRCRFVDHNPSAVTALAFPPLRLPSPSSSKSQAQAAPGTTMIVGGGRGGDGKKKFGVLAVGRANGNVEVCGWTGREYDVQSAQGWQLAKVRRCDLCVFVVHLSVLPAVSSCVRPHAHARTSIL